MDLRALGVSVLAGLALSSAASASGPDADWQARARDELARREYWASETAAGLQAPNRAHDLRTWFEPTGIRVQDRTAPGSPELVRLSLFGVGRGGALRAAQPGEAIAASEGRVEVRRPGIVEWYVNGPRGLEQGFTLTDRPAGRGPLVVELAVAGARPALRGDAIVLDTGSRRLRYGALRAVDGAGRPLAAHLAVTSPQRLRIVVDDAGASWPVTIDPLLQQSADAQLESNQAAASFGWSVAGAGDVNGDGYDDVIVGAIRYDAGQADEGAAFVFLGSPTGIGNGNPTTAAAQLESNLAGAYMGWSVAGAGDVNGDGYDDVIVGARSYSAGQSAEGAAFVFLGSASGIASGNPSTAAAQLESNQANAFMGWSVAGAGDVNHDGYDDVIVGAPSYASGQSAEGAAFVFLGSASGIADGNPGTAAAVIQSDQASANLGRSVAGAGDVNHDGYDDVIVGAPNYDGTLSNEGAAFVFLGSATGVASGNPTSAATRLLGGLASAAFGSSVAGAGDVNGDHYADVIVGAPTQGAAFVFLGSASGIADATQATAATQLTTAGGTSFGTSVAGAGDVNGDGYADVIVGDPNFSATQPAEGGAFVYFGSALGVPSGSPATANVELVSGQLSAYLGQSVAGAGDVNGDGGADVIVGSYFFESVPGEADEGIALVYHGVPVPEPAAAGAAALAALAALRRGRAARPRC